MKTKFGWPSSAASLQINTPEQVVAYPPQTRHSFSHSSGGGLKRSLANLGERSICVKQQKTPGKPWFLAVRDGS